MDNAELLQSTRPVTPFGIFCWALFDWAHSAFPTVIITFIFSTYFAREIAANKIIGTADWGWTIGVSGIIVAVFSPFLGAITDHTGKRKPWIAVFLLISALFTALLWFATPGIQSIRLAIVFVCIANIAYEFTQIFYNSMMVSLAPRDMIGRISGWGWGLGYFGGLACLAVVLFVFIKGGWLPATAGLHVRAATIFVAAWFIVFATPLFIFTPDVKGTSKSMRHACSAGLKELWDTLKKIRQYKAVFTFLLAHLIYIDGLNSIFIFAGVFAAGTFHMNYEQILIFASSLPLHKRPSRN